MSAGPVHLDLLFGAGRRSLWRWRCAEALWWGLLAGSVGLLACAALHVSLRPVGPDSWVPVLLAGPLLAGAAALIRGRPGLELIAALLDRRAGQPDLFASALEARASPLAPAGAAVVLARAEQLAATLPVPRQWGERPRWRQRLAPLPAALLLAGLYLLTLPGAGETGSATAPVPAGGVGYGAAPGQAAQSSADPAQGMLPPPAGDRQPAAFELAQDPAPAGAVRPLPPDRLQELAMLQQDEHNAGEGPTGGRPGAAVPGSAGAAGSGAGTGDGAADSVAAEVAPPVAPAAQVELVDLRRRAGDRLIAGREGLELTADGERPAGRQAMAAAAGARNAARSALLPPSRRAYLARYFELIEEHP